MQTGLVKLSGSGGETASGSGVDGGKTVEEALSDQDKTTTPEFGGGVDTRQVFRPTVDVEQDTTDTSDASTTSTSEAAGEETSSGAVFGAPGTPHGDPEGAQTEEEAKKLREKKSAGGDSPSGHVAGVTGTETGTQPERPEAEGASGFDEVSATEWALVGASGAVGPASQVATMRSALDMDKDPTDDVGALDAEVNEPTAQLDGDVQGDDDSIVKAAGKAVDDVVDTVTGGGSGDGSGTGGGSGGGGSDDAGQVSPTMLVGLAALVGAGWYVTRGQGAGA